jgi:hypothetical protein
VAGPEPTSRVSVSTERVTPGASFAAPLVGSCLRAGTGDQATASSFVSVSNPLVDLVTIAPERHGDGIVIFLHSLADETDVTFSLLRPTRVQSGNYLGRHLEDVALSSETATVTLTPGAYVAVVIS